MADPEHLYILKQGVDVWNRWRKNYPEIVPDLSNANLQKMDLEWVNFEGANLRNAILTEALVIDAICCAADLSGIVARSANFCGTNLYKANLHKAIFDDALLLQTNFENANLSETDFQDADLRSASLRGANLYMADFSGADLRETDLSMAIINKADLSGANLSGADLSGAILDDCFIYATAAWDVQLRDVKQSNLIITNPYNLDEPNITVDNLEVAQFIYLLLHNPKIRRVIDTITSKVVLILGRFTPERKAVLDAVRDELRNYNLVPVVFDFKGPDSRDVLETVGTLIRMSHFVIADITDPVVVREELIENVPHIEVPIQPLLHVGSGEYQTFKHIKKHPWVLPTFYYQDISHLKDSLKDYIIKPVEDMIEGKKLEKAEMKRLEEENRKLREEIEELKRGKSGSI